MSNTKDYDKNEKGIKNITHRNTHMKRDLSLEKRRYSWSTNNCLWILEGLI